MMCMQGVSLQTEKFIKKIHESIKVHELIFTNKLSINLSMAKSKKDMFYTKIYIHFFPVVRVFADSLNVLET